MRCPRHIHMFQCMNKLNACLGEALLRGRPGVKHTDTLGFFFCIANNITNVIYHPFRMGSRPPLIIGLYWRFLLVRRTTGFATTGQKTGKSYTAKEDTLCRDVFTQGYEVSWMEGITITRGFYCFTTWHHHSVNSNGSNELTPPTYNLALKPFKRFKVIT